MISFLRNAFSFPSNCYEVLNINTKFVLQTKLNQYKLCIKHKIEFSINVTHTHTRFLSISLFICTATRSIRSEGQPRYLFYLYKQNNSFGLLHTRFANDNATREEQRLNIMNNRAHRKRAARGQCVVWTRSSISTNYDLVISIIMLFLSHSHSLTLSVYIIDHLPGGKNKINK